MIIDKMTDPFYKTTSGEEYQDDQ